MDVKIEIDSFLTTVDYDYDAFHLTMHCFICHFAEDTYSLLEHSAARWLTYEILDDVDWLPADIEVINEIRRQHIL